MNLLFLTPQLPYPPHSGTALRNWGIIRELARRHEITLLTFAGPGTTSSPEARHPLSVTRHAPPIPNSSATELAEPPERLLQEIVFAPNPARSGPERLLQQFLRRPDLAYRLRSSRFDAVLRRLLEGRTFDVIQIEGLEMAGALKAVRATATKALVVYDAHNVEYVLQRSAFLADVGHPRRWAAALYSLLQWPRLKRYEARVCRYAGLVSCVSDQDAHALGKIAPAVRPLVIPNGLWIAEYSDVRSEKPGVPSVQGLAPEDRSLVFTGKMDYRPNLDAVEWFIWDILPRIHARAPVVRFTVVGQNPPPSLASHSQEDRVLLVGAVPDTRPYIAGASVCVMPLRMGGGTRFKLLEAMALGVPVVSTRKGAEGFPVAHERELLIADSAEDFARAVLRLLGDWDLRQVLSLAGRRFVEARYDWSAIVPRLEAAYGV